MSVDRARRRAWLRTAVIVWLFPAVVLFGPLSKASSEEALPVYPNAESVRPLAVGQTVPSAEVRTIDGESVDLATLVADRGALLVFYRGGW